MPNVPISSPSPPPATDRTRLSISTWRAIWARVPPSAARTASSRRRPEARTSRRLATFAQAMSSTKPTAPDSTSRLDRTLRTSRTPTGSTLKPEPGDMPLANFARKSAADVCSRARACSSVTPARSRPAVLK
jgi:hypothetical protein